ncbi:MAG: hypothetical protein WAV41_04995 [Microgenomates group bacterium]
MKNKILLILILLFSFAIYTFKLSTIPPSAYADEATVGYNAYSILTTGTDEFGQPFPLLFRFFNAYTPGLFVYAAIPFIKLFGISVFSIRILSAITGTISVFFFYKTLSLLSKNSLVGTAFYTILPWTIFNSRIGYEVMFAATIFNLGCYYLLKNINNISYFGLLLISLSTYTAHTQRYLAPIFLLVYFIYFKKLNLKSLAVLLFTQIPNLILVFTHSFWIKNNHLSLKLFLSQIISYLSPKTLFFSSPDIDLQHQIPSISLFFWWMIIPLIFSLKKLFTLDSKHQKFIVIWLICSIIPASLSGEFMSTQRVLPLLFPLMLVISLGLSSKIFINSFLFIYSLVLVCRSYYIFLPHQLAKSWDYGYKQLSSYIMNTPDKKFLIDNTRNPRTYILPLFYNQYVYKRQIDNYYSAPVLEDKYSYSNLTFEPLVWGDINQYDYIVSDGLSISPDQALEHHLTSVQKIMSPDNAMVLEIYKVDSVQ